MPVADLSALYALRKGDCCSSKQVLITGSTGGVESFANQLAALSRAYSIEVARSESKTEQVRTFGANEILVEDDITKAISANGPYDFIIDSVGGDTLAALFPQLIPQGICVPLGHFSSETTTLNILGLGEIDAVAHQLIERQFTGKAVLTI
ncbi:zinc-binding dehydrogenase [Paenibacillus sp. NPDC057934]|uniref:zinc-binding dehydrogenase n=1 Tax=Paenibacillus sp. NPDC057934 TaxID=3346282 RepID=UPI0036DC83A2